MMRQWRHWSDQVPDYPMHPVVFRRRGIFLAFAGMLWLAAAYFAVEVLSAPSQEGMSGSEAWQIAFFAVLFGACALYGDCRVVVTGDHVVVLNPVTRVIIPLADLQRVVPGWHMTLVTRSGVFRAWAVEARNQELASQTFGTQADFAGFLTAQITKVRPGYDEMTAKLSARPPAFVVVMPVVVLGALAAALGANGQPLGVL